MENTKEKEKQWYGKKVHEAIAGDKERKGVEECWGG